VWRVEGEGRWGPTLRTTCNIASISAEEGGLDNWINHCTQFAKSQGDNSYFGTTRYLTNQLNF